MTFFGMGPFEILVILVVALLVFGPDKLPQVARQVGGLVRDFRRLTSNLTAEFEAVSQEFSSEFSELRAATQELQAELRGVQQDLRGVQGDLQRELTGVDEALRLEPGVVGTDGSPGAMAAAPGEQATVAPTGYGTATVMDVSAESNGHSQPVATKSNPLADVSFVDLEELVIMPRTPRRMNGHQVAASVPAAPPAPAAPRPRPERRPASRYQRPRLR